MQLRPTDCPSLNWLVLLFSMKIEINPSLNLISLARKSDNSENLRKPEEAKTNISNYVVARDHSYQYCQLIS